jgi:hypothetical protein
MAPKKVKNLFIVLFFAVNKKAEPFDAYRDSGYRQATISETSTNSPRLNDVSFLTACSFTMNIWRYSSAKNKSKSSISISKYEQKR